MRPPEEVKKILVNQWLDKAEQDMKAGEALLGAESPLLYPACFHGRQAAEKYLKALLTWHQIEFPKTHAIEHLLGLLRRVDTETASALGEAAELTPYGVDIRYPGDQMEPDYPESRRALELARRVRDEVLSMLSVQ
ncbi:MAG: HEPN domain-containing protein [Desulfomonilaceae bacterium]|nr:HEPN domain-containing protein [Desulfomonilaceae bacterium]